MIHVLQSRVAYKNLGPAWDVEISGTKQLNHQEYVYNFMQISKHNYIQETNSCVGYIASVVCASISIALYVVCNVYILWI